MVGIQGVGGIPEPNPERPSGVRDRDKQSVSESTNRDGVEISASARQAANLSRLLQLAEEAPDIRADRVAEAKERIEREDFRLQDVVSEVASQISRFLD